ncbi:hypothetical protein MMC16_005812 [Acarospora aff. strigata]|nr:hypothetical protein [Acarospora aff. strigata]
MLSANATLALDKMVQPPVSPSAASVPFTEADDPTQLSPPFSATTSPLHTGDPVRAAQSTSTLPAAYCDHHNSLVRLGNNRMAFVRLDMDVSRLNILHKYLWLAGRPMGARSLHRQRMMERQIIITEQADLHLVWHESRMFLKPLPDYLLDYQLWKETICKDDELHASACGFLLSYVWLVCQPSDLRVATELGLLSSHIRWVDWTIFVDTFLSNIDYDALDTVNKRYRYGELRLNRLNAIYRLTHMFEPDHFVRGYMYDYNHYAVFFDRNFRWVLLIFIYMTVILTAMQVGLATEQLQHDQMFQQASYGFTVFSIVLPVVTVGGAASMFLCLFVFNFLATRIFLQKRRQNRRGMIASEVP